METTTSGSAPAALTNGGEMGARTREYDWASSTLGPIGQWPQSLRTALSVVLNSRYPMYLAWGPDFIEFYNDAFTPILGAKHPVLGHSSRDTWAEIWPEFVGPFFNKVRSDAEVVSLEDALVPINRFGFMEECYFSFCYSPVRDESGNVGGVLTTCMETTSHVVGDRRMRTLRELATQAGEAPTRSEACRVAVSALSGNQHDLPFVGIYLVQGDSGSAHRACVAGISEEHPFVPSTMSLVSDDANPWPAARAVQSGAQTLAEIPAGYIGNLSAQTWPEPVTRCAIVPVHGQSGDDLAALILVGVSPRRPIDDGYRSFLDLIATYVGRAVGNAGDRQDRHDAAEEERTLIETVHRFGEALTTNLELAAVVQMVTDEATSLSGAEFGAFFYNLVNEAGESYTLYTISGVAREQFSRFPMPRNTMVFDPTFRGTEIVRSDDITADPRYGRNAPYHGLPKGHLPVVSYLAVPVISRAGAVLGGLFFGHSQRAVFTRRHERLVAGIATWAAVAIDNASLYDAERRARMEADLARREAERASRAKSEFLAMMSHELRTPLNAIAGYVDLIRLDLRGPTTPQQQDDLVRIRRSQQHLSSLINDVLNFARIESGKLELVMQDVALSALFADLETFVAQQAASKHIAYSVVPFEESLAVRADEERLRQIMLNLLTNAMKFTPDGGSVTVACEADERIVRILVRDTGRGVPSSMLETIFEPFMQVEGRRTAPGERGIGLGLPISRDLARLMDGDVSVTSAEGRGSTFTVTLARA